MPMRQSPEIRPKPADALVALFVILLAAALALGVWGRGAASGLSAVISVDGRVTETVNLSLLTGPEVRELTANGYTLRLRLSPDGAEVLEADCPNQVCVHTGAIHRAGQSVVCLPARISVMLAGTTDDGVDAVVG